MKKKIALILAFTLFAPAVMTLSHGAKAASDLAVGDPMGKGGTTTTTHHHRHHKKKAAASTEAGAAKETAKPAAEKAPEKAAEPAK